MRTECTRGKMETTCRKMENNKMHGPEPFQMEKKSLFCANILTVNESEKKRKASYRKRPSNTGNECKTQ